MNAEVKSAIITVLQFIAVVSPVATRQALEDMDLSDEGLEDDLDVLKRAVEWED